MCKNYFIFLLFWLVLCSGISVFYPVHTCTDPPRNRFDPVHTCTSSPQINFDPVQICTRSPQINFALVQICICSPRINFDLVQTCNCSFDTFAIPYIYVQAFLGVLFLEQRSGNSHFQSSQFSHPPEHSDS